MRLNDKNCIDLINFKIKNEKKSVNKGILELLRIISNLNNNSLPLSIKLLNKIYKTKVLLRVK